MKQLIRMAMVFGLAWGAGLTAQAQEAKDAAGQKKELKFAGAPYIYTGPDTGFGAGFSIMYRDMLGKEGRDTTFSVSITQSRYQYFSINWSEPAFLSPQGRLSLYLSYDSKPAIRFYGLGNYRGPNDDSNWSWLSYQFSPTYIYRWPATEHGTFGMRLSFVVKYADPDDGMLEDKSDSSFHRKVSEAYPHFYHSWHFDQAWLVGVGLNFYRDTRVDRFPLGGGREEIVWPKSGGYEEFAYTRYDEALGSDYSFHQMSFDVRRYFPLFSEDTIVAVRGKVNISQGNVPFYQMPSYGNGNDLRGYYGMRFVDKNTTQFQMEIRQAIAPNWQLSVLGGMLKAKYPTIFIFWDEARVYDDYNNIADNLFEDYHYTWGFGVRIVVTPTIVIRAEWGYSDEQNTFAVNAGLPF